MISAVEIENEKISAVKEEPVQRCLKGITGSHIKALQKRWQRKWRLRTKIWEIRKPIKSVIKSNLLILYL